MYFKLKKNWKKDLPPYLKKMHKWFHFIIIFFFNVTCISKYIISYFHSQNITKFTKNIRMYVCIN